jgi:hypothetical protein
MAAPSAVGDVVSGLSRLRARIRALFAVTGLARWLAVLAAALVLFFAADVFLDLPLSVRRFLRLGLLDRPPAFPLLLWLPVTAALGVLALLLARGGRGAAGFVTFLFAGLAGLLAWWAWRAFRPLSLRMTDDELVLAVERRNPQLEDRLAAALDFSREIAPGGAGATRRADSVPMMQAVIHQAAREAQKVRFAEVARGRVALAWLGAAGLAVLAAAVVFGIDAGKTALWARRSLLLEDVAWPRASDVLAVLIAADGTPTPWPPEKPYEVAVGRGLVVNAQVRGKPVNEVQLLDLAEGQQPLPRRMFPVTQGGDTYMVELTNVRQAFRFVLRGGDDQDDVPVYRVEVTVPPAVLDIGADLAYPAYLGRPAERVQGGNLALPQGTEVSVTFTASVPLAEARALLGEQTVAAERLAADGGGEAWRFAFQAGRSLRYRLLLRSTDGRENDPTADSFEVVVEEDRAPRIEWIWPRGGVEVPPTGRVPLLLRTLDDHGVADLTLELKVGADGPVHLISLVARPEGLPGVPEVTERDGRRTLEANDGPLGRPQVLTYVPLEIAPLAPPGGFRPPVALSVRVVAKDSKGQAREGLAQTIDVYGPAELERILATRRSGVKSSITNIQADAKAGLARAEELAKGPIGDAEKDLLKSVQYAQGKLERDVDGAVRDYIDVFNLFVLDRLGSPHPTERILALYDRHHRRTYGVLPAGTAAGGHADDPVFPYALYDEVIAAWRAQALMDTGVLDRMCAVLADAVEVAERLAPRSHAAAVRAAAGGLPEVEALRVAEQALVDGLDRLIASLGSWESLSDVILKLKRIYEEQKVLLEQLEKTPPDRGGPDSPR